MDELGLLKMSLLSIIATKEVEILEKTKDVWTSVPGIPDYIFLFLALSR